MPKVIVIDPGHGGTQAVGGSSPNNATGPGGLLEKALTLQVGSRITAHPALRAHKVVMTRTADVNVGIDARAKLARDSNAAVFVSLHFNGSDNPSIQGSEAWIGKGSLPNCRMLAREVLDRLVAANGLRDRGVKTTANAGDYGVINPANQLSTTAFTLVELSFLTDPAEEARLKTAGYLDAVAGAIATAIDEYLRLVSETGSVLHFAARSGSVETVRALIAELPVLDRRDANGMTPLMVAAHSGHAKVVQMLIEAGANADATIVSRSRIPQGANGKAKATSRAKSGRNGGRAAIGAGARQGGRA